MQLSVVNVSVYLITKQHRRACPPKTTLEAPAAHMQTPSTLDAVMPIRIQRIAYALALNTTLPPCLHLIVSRAFIT